MNIEIIRSYIDQYKKNFERINQEEIYKWHAVKCFQDNWNLDTSNFPRMLERSLSKTKNLMESGNYYPRKVLLSNAIKSPKKIKELFVDLYDEECDYIERMQKFITEFNIISKENFNWKNSFQDPRAVIVYLTLKYPDRYFLYKFDMFKHFTEKIYYPYRPIKGRYDNIVQYFYLCDIIRDEISKDQELLKLHKNRIDEECYFDKNLTLLTQDFIYAVVRHLKKEKQKDTSEFRLGSESEYKADEFNNPAFKVSFETKLINYSENDRENKRTGNLGELWVIDYEKKKLKNAGNEKLINKIEHISKEKGDGAGFDILSFDETGKKIFIEVKTTKGNFDQLFYISRNELERSIQENEKYYLYRVHNYKEKNNSADLMKIKGSLVNLCDYPTQFKTKLNPIK